MNADGSGQINLTNYGAPDYYPKWSPDGRKIVFASSRDDPNPSTCAETCQYKLYMMNPDGSDQIRLANYNSSNPFPSWSP
jgi:TolB protein